MSGWPRHNPNGEKYSGDSLGVSMGDMGDDFRAWKQAGIEKRAANRAHGAKYLADMGIHFEAKNDGAHLIVTHLGKVADYWPGTGKFKVRDGKWGRGVLNLVRALAPSDIHHESKP